MGYGQEYRYAHDEPGAYAAGEKYLPPEMGETQYYFPTKRGLETKIGEKLDYLADLTQKAHKNAMKSSLFWISLPSHKIYIKSLEIGRNSTSFRGLAVIQ